MAGKADMVTRIHELTNITKTDVAMVYAPAADDATIARIINHCERERFRFAVIATMGKGF